MCVYKYIDVFSFFPISFPRSSFSLSFYILLSTRTPLFLFYLFIYLSLPLLLSLPLSHDPFFLCPLPPLHSSYFSLRASRFLHFSPSLPPLLLLLRCLSTPLHSPLPDRLNNVFFSPLPRGVMSSVASPSSVYSLASPSVFILVYTFNLFLPALLSLHPSSLLPPTSS